MSDTYFLRKIKCAYCERMNNFGDIKEGLLGLPYKDEFGADFICKWCNKKNKIQIDFVAVRLNSKTNKR